MSEINEQKKLNPQITEVEIGIREMRKIKIYPLSMSDQLSLTNLISEAIGAFVAREEAGDIAVVSFILELVKENIGRILTMITDEDDKLLEEISNLQAAAIAEVVYETNYGTVAKNFKSLFEKAKTLFPSERPLPEFANDIPDTGLKTSTESPSEKEESPSDS